MPAAPRRSPLAHLASLARRIIAGMKPTPFYLWWITDERGRRRRTTYRMTEAEARERHPGAEPVEGSREIRNLPESVDEHEYTQPGRSGLSDLSA